MADVKIADAAWLRSLGHVNELRWSSRWGSGPCGPSVASCTVDVAPSEDSPLLRVGRSFVIEDGVLVFGGETTTPQRGYPWNLSAKGLAARANDFLALDSAGAPTTNPRTAVTEAITRGLPWTNPTAFDNAALGEVPKVAQRLDTLLDQWGTTVGKRWGTDDYGVAFAQADPTVPTLFLDAFDLDIGVAEDGLYSAVHSTYVNSVDGDGNPDGWDYEFPDDPLAEDLYNRREYEMDLTGLGLLSGGTAASHAAEQLALMTVPQWLSRITTNSDRLRTAGFHPAHLPTVRAGQMARLYNVPNNLGGLRGELGLDVVLGEVEYDTTRPEEITLAPVGLAVRNVADMAATVKSVAATVGKVGMNFPVWDGRKT